MNTALICQKKSLTQLSTGLGWSAGRSHTTTDTRRPCSRTKEVCPITVHEAAQQTVVEFCTCLIDDPVPYMPLYFLYTSHDLISVYKLLEAIKMLLYKYMLYKNNYDMIFLHKI